MGRYGLGTRVVMVVLGAVWIAGGAAWLYFLGPDYLFRDRSSSRLCAIPLAILFGGVMLFKTGVTPDRPKTFEDEIADAHPDLSGDDWGDLDD
jgi:hypothetical protein